MRSWIGASVSFGVVVTMVHDRSQVSSGVRQAAHRPAKANGSPPGRLTQYGCLGGRGESSSFRHS